MNIAFATASLMSLSGSDPAVCLGWCRHLSQWGTAPFKVLSFPLLGDPIRAKSLRRASVAARIAERLRGLAREQLDDSSSWRLMAEDYGVAAVRHYRDAVLLEEHQRISNADHHFGFAAECALKSVLVNFPGFVTAGRLAGAYHKHVNELWDSVPLQNVQKRHGAMVAVLKQQRPFHDWSVRQRYETDAVVTPAAAANHRQAAKRLLGSVGLLGTRAGA